MQAKTKVRGKQKRQGPKHKQEAKKVAKTVKNRSEQMARHEFTVKLKNFDSWMEMSTLE